MNIPSKEAKLTKKSFLKLKEVSVFYKFVHKYNLRQEAYKALLKLYIQNKKPKKP